MGNTSIWWDNNKRQGKNMAKEIKEYGEKRNTKVSIIRVFACYLRQYRFTIFMYIIFILIFRGVFCLYQVEKEAVFYGTVLYFLLLLIVLPMHFIHYYLKHKELFELKGRSYLEVKQIPDAKGLIENDYRELLLEWVENTVKEKSRLRIYKEDSIEFYSTWVHQIKTPIAVMKLWLQEEDTEENGRLLLELSRIEQYADMVLSYFRLDATAKDLVIREYSLDEIIRSCIRRHASWFVTKGISVRYEKTDLKVLTDKKWLTFMIEQILSNAIKYTDEGSITIRAEEGPFLYIEDTGIGIAKEDLPRIFEKGFTGYNRRADKKSTGIGLYLVKRTVDLLGTPVNVQSSPGQGTAFSIDLRKNYMELE